MKNCILKEKLRKQKLTIGSWVTLPDTAVAEIMSKSGFDWLAVDMEHSVITLDKAQEIVRIIQLCGIEPLVRVEENSASLIKRVMDTGAHGVIVPMVNSREDALKAVNAVKYPPIGKRGVGLARAQGYGLGFQEYKNWINKNSIVIVQIEHVEAVENLEDILGVEGVDGFIVGPYDLSASLGIPGDFKNSRVESALREIIQVSRKIGKTAGFHVIMPREQELLEKVKQGYRFIGFSLDTIFLGLSCSNKLEGLRKALKGKI